MSTISLGWITISFINASIILLWGQARALNNSTLGSYWHIFNDTMLEAYLDEAKDDMEKLAPLTKLYLKEALERIERNQFPKIVLERSFSFRRV